MITKENAEKIKKQLINQAENFPKEKKHQIIEHINSMSPQEVEDFIKQNQELSGEIRNCIFCSIADGKIKSYKIGEDKENIAILEINPFSKAHTLIIPKKHLDKLNNSSEKLAQEIAEKIKKIFNPKRIKIEQGKIMNHALINLIPIYEKEPQKRMQVNEEELKKIQNQLTKEIAKEPVNLNKTEKEARSIEKLHKLKPRIP